MSGAHFRIDQAANPIPTGTTDTARIDIWEDRPLLLVATDTVTGSPTWTLMSGPPGASLVLSGATTNTATLALPKCGSYDVEYLVGDGTGVNRKKFVIRVTRNTNGLLIDDGQVDPAVGEEMGDDNSGGNIRGWDARTAALYSRVVPMVANFAALRQRMGRNHSQVQLMCYEQEDDGGEGLFRWVSTSTAGDDGGRVVQPGFGTGAALATGRWHRVVEDGAYHLTHYGIRGNDNQANAPTNTTRLNALWLAHRGGFGKRYKFRAGLFWFNDTLLFDRIGGSTVSGAGMQATVWQYTGANDATRVKPFLLVRRAPENTFEDLWIVAGLGSNQLGKCVRVTSDGQIDPILDVGQSGPIGTGFRRCKINFGNEVSYQLGSDTDIDTNTDRCWLQDCQIGTSGMGDYGVRISNTNTNNFQITGGSVESNRLAGIVIEKHPRGTLIQNVQMSGNSIYQQFFTVNTTTDFITTPAGPHGLVNGQIVYMEGYQGGVLPGNLTELTPFYVRNKTSTTFQVSLTPAGSIVDILAGGTGQWTILGGADIWIKDLGQGGVTIKSMQGELHGYPFLKCDAETVGDVSLEDFSASYSILATDPIYKNIDYRGYGTLNLKKVRCYGPAPTFPGSTAPIYVNPVANAEAGPRTLHTEGVILLDGAVMEVRTTGNGAMRWINKGVITMTSLGDVAPGVPHHRLYEKIQSMAYGNTQVPVLPGVTISDVPLLGGKAVKFVFDKTAFKVAATSVNLAFFTIGKWTRIKHVVAEVTEAFDVVAGPIQFAVGDTSGHAFGYLPLQLASATAKFGLNISELGAQLYGGAAMVGGHIGSFTGDAQLNLHMTAGGNLGNGTVTNFAHGSLTVMVSFEEMLP